MVLYTYNKALTVGSNTLCKLASSSIVWFLMDGKLTEGKCVITPKINSTLRICLSGNAVRELFSINNKQIYNAQDLLPVQPIRTYSVSIL